MMVASESFPRFQDQRSRNYIYVSSCLLNQNRRFPGIAISEGVIPGLFDEVIRRGIGIEQLPCLECFGWGGISRNSISRFIPVFFRYSGSRLFPLVRIAGGIWLRRYRRLCKKKAREIVRDIKESQASGYSILSIIAMNDSPTCGATKTLNILDMITQLKERGVGISDIRYPHLDVMKKLIPDLLREGQGYFMEELLKGLEQNDIVIPVMEFNPWVRIQDEVERITASILKL